MKRKLVSLFLLVIMLQACDPGYDAKIINESDKPIEVIFKYDKKIILENIENKISFNPEVIYSNEGSRNSFKIDRTNFIVTTIVQSKDTLDLEMGIGTLPDFRNIKLIKIFGSDTIKLEGKEKMINAFSKKEKYRYELIIK